MIMKKILLFLFAITLFLAGSLFAQVAGDFRSVASGNWNSAATWEIYNLGVWAPAASFPNSTTAIATVQAGHTLTLSGAAQVKTLKLDGIVTTTSINTLTINYLGSIIGGSAAAYIDGPLHLQITTVANVPKNINVPLGKGSVGRPVVFRVGHNRTNMITYMLEMFNAAPPPKTLPATLASVSSVRYYTIARTNVAGLTSNCNLTFKYDTDDAVGANNSLLRIVRDGLTAWTDLGGTGSAPVTGVITSVTPTALNASISLAAPTNNVFTLGFVNSIISGNAGVVGATLSWVDGVTKTTISAANGTYSIYVPGGWSGTITPSLQYYNFTPVNMSYTSVAGNIINQNYTALSIFTNFRSAGPGDWNDPLIWEGWDGTAWVPSSVPTGAAGSILIRDVDMINVNVPISLEAGCTLTNAGILNVNGSLTVRANATLVNIGSFGNPGGTLYVYGTLEHRQDGGMIGVAGNFGWTATNYYAGSKILVTGVVNAAPTVPVQTSFPSMVWDCPNQATDAFLSINGIGGWPSYKESYVSFGSLTVLNSNSKNIFMFGGQGRSVGNIVVDGPTSKVTAFTHSSSGIEYAFFSYFSSLSVQNGGQFYINTDPGNPGIHYATINIHNNLSVSSNSVLANYGYPHYSGPSFAKIVFAPNYPHNIDLSGQVPAPGLDDRTNNLNFVINANTVTLLSPIKANNLDFFGTGKIVSGGNLITMVPGGIVTGASATNFTDGPVNFQVATSAPTTMIFPVGKGTVGRPVTLNVTQDAATLTTYTAEMKNPPIPTNALAATLASVSPVRYYNISKSAGANVTAGSVLLNYSTDDAVLNNSLLRIAKADGSGNWVNLGGIGTAPITGTITSTTNFNTSSDFALGYAFCVNPIDGGTIAAPATSGCVTFDPALITGTVITGTVEYKWQSSVAPFTTWTDIAGNIVSYDPTVLTETTWYKRLVRASCTPDWIGATESNVLTMSIILLSANAITGVTTVCAGTSSVAYGVTTDNSATATYSWSYIGQGATLSATTGSAITINFANTATNGTLTVIETITATGCSTTNTQAITINQCFKTLNLTLFLEGLYNGGGTMRQAQGATGNQFSGTTADQITIELHSAVLGQYATINYSAPITNLSTTGLATIIVPSTYSGSYYVTVKQRNSIETVSALPVSFTTSIINYDFSTTVAQAFGSNMKNIGGVFAIYGGDVNKDGIIDISDMIPVDNLSALASSGYLPEDVNGDGLIDISDMIIIDNNSSQAIGIVTP